MAEMALTRAESIKNIVKHLTAFDDLFLKFLDRRLRKLTERELEFSERPNLRLVPETKGLEL